MILVTRIKYRQSFIIYYYYTFRYCKYLHKKRIMNNRMDKLIIILVYIDILDSKKENKYL